MSDANSPAKPATLSGLLQDAAVQRRLMQGWSDDQAFIGAGGKIVYAVDMDVIYMHANPAQASQAHPARLPYGQVFRDDDRAVAQSLTVRLADWIFYEVSGDVPLLILPPIDMELGHYLEQKVEALGVKEPEPRRVEPEELNQLLAAADQLDQAGPNDIEIIQDTLNKAQQLLYLERGPAGEFRRVGRLLSLKRIAGPDAPAFLEALDDPVVANAIRGFDRITDIWRHSLARDEWIDRLTHPGNSDRRLQVERDGSALARLELWNKTLAPHRCRIVYITGSRTLFEAGWAYYPTERVSDANPQPSFGDLYLRHPRAFVAEPRVLETGLEGSALAPAAKVDQTSPSYEQADFVNMVRLFLATFKPRGDLLDSEHPFRLSKHGREVAREAAPAVGQDIRATWEGYTAALRPTYQPPGSAADLMTEAFLKTGAGRSTINRWEQVRAHLEERIETELKDSWEACIRAATQTGLSMDFFNPAEGGQAARSVPPLSFDSWEQTHHFIDMVSRWHSGNDFKAEAYEQGIADIQKENDTGYAYYLAHAALFGGRGKWAIAAHLANRALSLTPGGAVDVEGHANGREASYLLAVCRRHAARSLLELDGLEALVERAETIWKAETLSRGHFEAIPERFEGERLAIKLTRLMYQRYCSAPPDDAWTERVADLLAELAGLHQIIHDRLAAATQALQQRKPTKRNGAERLVRTLQKLDLRVSTNLASVLMVDAKLEDLRSDGRFRAAATQLIAYERAADDKSPEISFFVRAVSYCAAVVLSDPGAGQRSALKKAKDYLTDYRIRRNSVFPYDEARLRQFRDLILS